MKDFKRRILYLFFLGFFPIFLSSLNNSSEGQIVFLENGKIELGFDKNTGSLLVFKDIVNLHNYLDKTISPCSLFEVQLLNDSEIKTFDMAASSKFNFSKRNNSLVLTWKNFSRIKNKDFKIKAVVTLDKDKALSFWKISVNGTEGVTSNRLYSPK